MFHKILTLLFFVFPFQCFAFRLSPMVMTFSPEGTKATQVLMLENPSNEKVPITIEAFQRVHDENGNEVRTKTSDFNIYPEQLVLLPNEKRNVRITYSGEAKGDTEKAYRIIATQLPVEFKEKNAKAAKPGVNLNFLLQYVASAYVKPEGTNSKIKVSDLKIQGSQLELKITNEGNAHQVLHPLAAKINSGTTASLELNGADLKSIEGTNLLPKNSKKFLLSLPRDFKAKDPKVEFQWRESED